MVINLMIIGRFVTNITAKFESILLFNSERKDITRCIFMFVNNRVKAIMRKILFNYGQSNDKRERIKKNTKVGIRKNYRY